MQDPHIDEPSAAELASAVVELPEWDRLRVRDYYQALVAAELGCRPPASQAREREPGQTSGVVVPLFRVPGHEAPSVPDSGEAA
jgi:hypothetical protein